MYHVVEPSSCLEPNQNYIIRLEFLKLNLQSSARENTILIDSVCTLHFYFDNIYYIPLSFNFLILLKILLVPVIETFKEFQSDNSIRYLNDYHYYGCREAQLNPYRYPMDEKCYKYICNVGVASIGALSCECIK